MAPQASTGLAFEPALLKKLEAELCLLIAEEIEDKEENKASSRMAISIAGKT